VSVTIVNAYNLLTAPCSSTTIQRERIVAFQQLLHKHTALLFYMYTAYFVWHVGVSERSADKNMCILEWWNDRRSQRT